jgi:hypothetical protein
MNYRKRKAVTHSIAERRRKVTIEKIEAGFGIRPQHVIEKERVELEQLEAELRLVNAVINCMLISIQK